MSCKETFSEIVRTPETEGEIGCWCEISADKDWVNIITDEHEGHAMLTLPAAKLVREAVGRAIDWVDALRGETPELATDGEYIRVRRETFRALEAENALLLQAADESRLEFGRLRRRVEELEAVNRTLTAEANPPHFFWCDSLGEAGLLCNCGVRRP